MPPALHNGVRLDERDRISDSAASGFTAVNGRSSPQTLKLSGNGSERRHSRPEVSPENDSVQDRRPLSQHPDPPDGPPTPRPPERDMRLSSPAKRKRSVYDEEENARRLDMYSRRRGSNSPSSEEEEEEEEEDDDDLILVDENGEPEGRMRGDFTATPQRDVSMSDAGTDALQREPGAADTSKRGHRADGPQTGQSSNGYGSATETTRAGVQFQKNKRKRVFSNRTKTGCQTCRKRKKKCDEAKPSCNNCTRGGFVCAGYLLKAAWPKTGAQNNHIPLQSKHGYPEHPGIFPRPAVEAYPGPQPPQSLEEARTRTTISVTDAHHAGAGAGPSTWATAWPPPLPHRAMNGFPRPTPPSEALRALQSYQEPNSYQHRQGALPAAIPHPQHLSTPPQQTMPAQLAGLQQQQRQPSVIQSVPRPPSQNPLSEREKMLTGGIFTPFMPDLQSERERCRGALWRFNNAVSTGSSWDEQIELFKKVLRAPETENAVSLSNPEGMLGKDSWIEAPFRCDFGYNIRIGNGVLIESGCTISDARTVVIGHGCILGKNVSISTLDWDKSPRDRVGVKGTASAMDVVIEDNVLIEEGVMILPGVRIGKGSRVTPGSLVEREVSRSKGVHADEVS
ncbi:Nodulation protein L [Diplodia seriata]|uniref:Nodulation protein L n=1 Tax=Diplodia seriata TaxID=420778 RepID=A0A1S8B702_9PEZI|nr:Nodulation protein L [Diplodia seriata]